jgi:AcrR family transcriptional regulator
VTREDWLVGNDRRTEAVDRIHAAATELITQRGFEAFTIDTLAARVHCSPATIYRHAGGKRAILEGVLLRLSADIVASVTEAIAGMTGRERVIHAIVIALQHIRSEPLRGLMRGTIRPGFDSHWLTTSPVVTGLAERMLGRADPLAAQWLIRVFFSLMFWPGADRDSEYQLVRHFVDPVFDRGAPVDVTPSFPLSDTGSP